MLSNLSLKLMIFREDLQHQHYHRIVKNPLMTFPLGNYFDIIINL